MSERVRKYEFALSDDVVGFVIFDGEPDAGCFQRLREYLAITEKALSRTIVREAKRKKPELAPCEKHPNAKRAEGARRDCLECRKEHVVSMVNARKRA